MKVKITGTGSCLPKLRVTNDDLGQIMETSDEWIRSRTGIIARHIAVEETTTGMSTEAAGKALKNADISAEDVDIIIAATVSADKHLLYLLKELLPLRRPQKARRCSGPSSPSFLTAFPLQSQAHADIRHVLNTAPQYPVQKENRNTLH